MSPSEVRLLRLGAQQLQPRPQSGTAIAQIVGEVAGVQAQDAKAAILAIGVRSQALVAADVERAIAEERSIVRTWAMRGTLHLIASADVGWLLALLGPVFVAGSKRRRAELGLDDETYHHGVGILHKLLTAQGPLTRAQIVAQMEGHGIKLVGQAAPHFIARAALEGILCCGPEQHGKPTYVLLDDWVDVDKGLPHEAALAELARRYLKAYAPATAEDMAAWSGLPISEVRVAWKHIGAELMEVDSGGSTLWMLKKQAEGLNLAAPTHSIVRLLPAFDTYLLGYRQRDLMIEAHFARRINAGGGMIAPTLLVDGQIQGVWRSKTQGKQIEVTVEPFADLSAEVKAETEAEVGNMGRFLGLTAHWKGDHA